MGKKMRKVDLIDQKVRPCNFNDFYYYPKYFTDENPHWIDDALRQHGGDYPYLYLLALDYALSREYCILAQGCLNMIVDAEIKADAYDKTSLYCSFLEE